ncbi:MAG: hypothetical protein HOA57_04870 [Candidatus Magasanikbacteria bacterium]|jgi:hypothetical protein|nr:hypothetical protein [Candidatus Magasanikbacteria bacterium]MBT4315313.1 hypothetical protein [Candidatus Magasanikbacteria bacterium]MBT4547185.1 hypothetical protein [Candidatus Magasanikbacteria bacterium]MBT6819675.1 hypothetical protein [Candidatus Magasanikbacteria bacterium]
MTHYVCTGGCGGVSETPGTCQAETCPLHEHDLKECNCEDGKHDLPSEEETKEE